MTAACFAIFHKPPTYRSLARFSDQWELREFFRHEVVCLFSSDNRIYWKLSFDPVIDSATRVTVNSPSI